MDSVALELASREILTLVTPGYRPPSAYSSWLSWLPGMPPFTMSVVDAMRRDYQVKLAMAMKAVPIMKPVFSVTGDPEVVEFVQNELRSIWTGWITDIAEAMWYTRFGCEMVYKRADDGLVRFARMMPYHPRDFRILTREGEIAGLKVIASNNSTEIDTSDPAAFTQRTIEGENDKAVLFSPKCFVYVHNRKFGSFEGYSELEGAFQPWMEKVREGGAIDSRSLWFYKCAFDSGIIKHPSGAYVDPNNPAIQVPYRDIALKVGESVRNGATIALESTYDANGNPSWEYERAQANPGGEIVLQLIDHLDGKINKGAGIPDDVIEQVSGTGSYAGRTIPFIAFLESGTPTVRNVCRELCRQNLIPMAQINYGEQRGKDWEIIEAKVNVDEFLDTGSQQVPGDGDGDGIPNEEMLARMNSGEPGDGQDPLQMSLNEQNLTSEEKKKLQRFRTTFAKTSVTFHNEYRTGRSASVAVQLSHRDQPRDDKGRFASTPNGTAVKGKREYSSTQCNIEGGSYYQSQGNPLEKIRELAAKISDVDLAEKGRETEFHVTVKYGIHSSDCEEVKKAISDFGPIDVSLGKTSVFECDEYDVVKIDAYGSSLHMLNRLVARSTECTDTHPDYKPHVTLAYVKKGNGKKYAGNDAVDGMNLVFDEVVFSSKDDSRETIKTTDVVRMSIADEPFQLKRERSTRFVPKSNKSQQQDLFGSVKLTHSPADDHVKKQVESLDGQQDLFGRPAKQPELQKPSEQDAKEPEKKSEQQDKSSGKSSDKPTGGRWITIGGHGEEGGGVHVFIGKDGRIEKGPSGIVDKKVSEIGSRSDDGKGGRDSTGEKPKKPGIPDNQPRDFGDDDDKFSDEQIKSAKDDFAKASGKDSLSAKDARKYSQPKYVKIHQNAIDEARIADVSTHDVLQVIPDAYEYRLTQWGLLAAARNRAIQLSGMSDYKAGKIENSYRDHSTVRGFDDAAKLTAIEHPELGFDPDSTDTPGKIWDLIRSEEPAKPKMEDRQTAWLAAEWVAQAKAHHGEKIDSRHGEPPDEDGDASFNFGANLLKDQLGDGDNPLDIWASMSQFDPNLHPRGDDGKFIMSVMREIEPGADRGALVSIREIRNSLGGSISKEKLDELIMQAAKIGAISLHHHDYPASLTPEQLAEMASYPADQDHRFGYKGRAYVVGAAIRQKA